MTTPTPPPPLSEETPYLDCAHCGGIAIESPDGLFGDGDGERCMTCGLKGHVSIDDSDPDPDENTAYWSSSDDPNDKCNEEDCEACRPTT